MWQQQPQNITMSLTYGLLREGVALKYRKEVIKATYWYLDVLEWQTEPVFWRQVTELHGTGSSPCHFSKDAYPTSNANSHLPKFTHRSTWLSSALFSTIARPTESVALLFAFFSYVSGNQLICQSPCVWKWSTQQWRTTVSSASGKTATLEGALLPCGSTAEQLLPTPQPK